MLLYFLIRVKKILNNTPFKTEERKDYPKEYKSNT